MNEIKVKRVYDQALEDDGFRVLVDRLWPRGITKDKAMLGLWARDIAPSNALRKEYHNNLDAEYFREHYMMELESNPEKEEFKNLMKEKLETSDITFLTSAKNMEFNHCHVIKDWLD